MMPRWSDVIVCASRLVALFIVIPLVAAGAPAPATTKSGGEGKSRGTDSESSADLNDLYDAGKQLFDTFAPPEVKAQYDFPTKEQWDAFAAKLQVALQSDSIENLADYAPQARSALATLRTLNVDPELADWLQQRLDEAEAAEQIRALPAIRTQPPVAPPSPPEARRTLPGEPPSAQRPPPAPPPTIPYYNLWLSRVRTRPAPADASALMPTLRRAFAAERVPPALAWVAEAESSLNPAARSPSGAKGLFQLTPQTARGLGLSTFLPDDRTDPDKSARAAARYLRELHDRFGTWPLALAAYNAGEGRVSRAIAAKHSRDFATVAGALPAETRMYVPKVCALVEVRAGTSIVGR
ncbi:MAG TPA: lytic transglycosylase domain-containing protein [Opitutaceae bacterium]|nr:lytic transglycosylase domain-containing protein [Opitutaceae bacterium]